jgi:hypothetical protein
MKTTLIFSFILSSFFCFLFSFLVQAAESQGSTEQIQAEKDLRVKVKTRAYSGGRDEEPLKVQIQLPNPNRKMHPAQEPLEHSEPGASND